MLHARIEVPMARTAIRWSVVVCFAIAAPRVALAQAALGALHGTVVAAPADAPLPLALALIPAVHREERTGPDGIFRLEQLPPGSHTVVVRAVGYRPQTITVAIRPGERTEVLVRLAAAAFELPPVVVTGTVGPRSGEDVLSPTTVVSGAELDRRLGGTVAATLEREPGVAVTSLGPATARPVIRGLGGDRILVLEDGARPGDLSAQSADHAVAVDPLTAGRIEVVRGPMGLLYGSSALGGVVNVVRGDVPIAAVPHAHGVAGVQGSSVNDGIAGGARVGIGLGRLALQGEAGGRTAADTKTPTGPLAGTQLTSLSAQLGAALIGDHVHGGASYRFYDSDYGVPGGFVGGHATDIRIAMRRHALRGEGLWHDPGLGFASLGATTTFTAYEHREFEPSGGVGTSFDQEVATLELIGRRGSPDRRQGALGLRGQSRDIATGGSLRTPDTRDLSAAAYAVEELVLGRVRLQGGLRYDYAHYDPLEPATILVGGERVPVEPRTFQNLSGSVGVLVEATDVLSLGANVARAFRTPDFNELYSNGPHLAANSYDVGDPRLEPEIGLGGEVLARLTTGAVRAEAAGFVNRLDNYIFPSSRGRAELGAQGNRPRFQYTNEDARFWGAEGGVTVRPAGDLVLDGTLSWVAARFTSERAPIPIISPGDTTFVPASPYPPLIPPVLGRAVARWDASRWFAGGGVRWAASQTRTGDFETPTDGYVIAEVTAGARVFWGGRLHAITLRVDNLFDREYRDHLSRLKDIAPAPGRDVLLLYRLEF
jgi:iron complex outermembrane recepter protein